PGRVLLQKIRRPSDGGGSGLGAKRAGGGYCGSPDLGAKGAAPFAPGAGAPTKNHAALWGRIGTPTQKSLLRQQPLSDIKRFQRREAVELDRAVAGGVGAGGQPVQAVADGQVQRQAVL